MTNTINSNLAIFCFPGKEYRPWISLIRSSIFMYYIGDVELEKNFMEI